MSCAQDCEQSHSFPSVLRENTNRDRAVSGKAVTFFFNLHNFNFFRCAKDFRYKNRLLSVSMWSGFCSCDARRATSRLRDFLNRNFVKRLMAYGNEAFSAAEHTAYITVACVHTWNNKLLHFATRKLHYYQHREIDSTGFNSNTTTSAYFRFYPSLDSLILLQTRHCRR